MKKRIAAKLLASMLALVMTFACVNVFPTTAAVSSTGTLCLAQDYDTLPTISTTAKASGHGVWSSAVSSSTGTHVTFSKNVNASDGRTSLRCAVATGRYTVNTYLGFTGAKSNSKLTFSVWIPAGSTITKISYIKIGSTTILNETTLTSGAWNHIETSTFGSNTSGVIEFQFYNNGGTANQKYYIDDLAISTGDVSFETEAKVNSYKMEAKSSSDTSRYRVKLTNSVAAGDVISFYVKPVAASGATVDGADMYARGNGTKAMYLDANGKETTVAVYSGSHIANYATKCSDGWYYIECVSKAACSSGFELSVDAGNITGGKLGQCLIADVEINGKDVTPVGFNSGSALTVSSITEPKTEVTATVAPTATPTPKPTATPTPKPTATPTPKPTATPTPKPTATPTPKPTATPTPKPTATPTPKPTATPTPKPTATPAPAAGTIYSYKMEAKSTTDSSRYRVKLTNSVAVGDVISFYVKPVAATGTIDGVDMYARGDGTKAIYRNAAGSETGVAVYSGQAIAKNAIFESDGWYYIECVVKAACASGFELSVDAGNMTAGTLGQCLIAGVKINGKEVTPVGFNSGATLTKSTMTEPKNDNFDNEEDDTTSTNTSFINMGYLPYYRTDCYKTLDYDALTHLCLAFFNPDVTSLEITDKFDSEEEIKAITKLAQDNGVKVLASYGGASGKTIYTEILPSSTKRAQLVENMIQHALYYGLDGIDIDIEASTSYTNIWNYYSDFISQLRKRCDEEGLLLTTAVAEWYGSAISSSTLKQFDIVGVMAYDDSGANHSTYEMAVEMVEYFIGRGVSKSKIAMGLPFYGYKANTNMEGSTSYKALCEADSSAYNKDLSNGIAYNGIPTIQKKCQYAMSKGLAGVMIWELGQDSTVEKYSLLRAIKLELYGENGAR